MSIALYRRYRQALKGEPLTGRFMPYDWSPLPDRLGVRWMAYSQMLQEFARELANAVNDLTHRERRLRAWATALNDSDNKALLDAQHAVADDVAVVALGLPYVVRSRFIYATAHLCHQANQARRSEWADVFALDDEVYMGVADEHGAGWKRYGRLKEKMQSIAGEDYRAATRNFRNLYNHRFSPRIGIGLSQFVTRSVNEQGGVRYSFGSAPPLSLAEIASALEVQRDRSYRTFENFQALVAEHGRAIVAFGD